MNKTSTFFKRIKKKRGDLLIMLIPSFIYFFIFTYVPLYGLQIAFKDYNSFLGVWDSPWVGLKHFVNFVTAPNFWSLIKNTLSLSVYSLIVFPLPIILALMINEVRNDFFKRTTGLRRK